MTKKTCEYSSTCQAEAEYLGWMFLWKGKLDDMEKQEYLFCKDHYLECMFSLYAFSCTEECFEQQQEILNTDLNSEDRLIWLPLRMLLAWDDDVSRKPKCPWCQREMQAADPAGVDKESDQD